MRNNIADEHKAFFAVAAITVPAVWFIFGISMFIGLFLAAFLVLLVKEIEKDFWQMLGALIDKKILTLSVLVGGTLVVLAQYTNSV